MINPNSLTKRANKCLIFVHIPRTGGSNLWHSTVYALAKRPGKVSVLDVFRESIIRYKTILNATDVISDLGLLRRNNSKRCFIHHHTSFGIWRVLGHDAKYFTLLRDPIDRAISHYFHSLSLYYVFNNDRTQCTLKPARQLKTNVWNGDDALPSFIKIAANHNLMSSEAIVEFVATHPGMARNYYVDFMHRYFNISKEGDLKFHRSFPTDAQSIKILSHKIQEHFSHIFYSLDEAFDFLESAFYNKITHRNRMRNEAVRPLIHDMEALRKSLLPYFKQDYYLLRLLRRESENELNPPYFIPSISAMPGHAYGDA